MAKLFISYSHRDEKALENLHKHLIMLRREGLIEEWFDRKILAGSEIDREVEINLQQSDVFLALVSPDFLASDYCYETEMTQALKRHEDGSIRVIPVILEPCDWKPSPLGKVKAIPKDGKPISLWTNENTAYLDIVTELRRVLAEPHRADESRQKKDRGVGGLADSARAKRYRIQREFDVIDRDDFREKSFEIIQSYFKRSIEELNEIGDPIRARFERMGDHAFTATVLNKAGRSKEAHITVRIDSERHLGGDISYLYAKRDTSGSSNGHIRVASNEHELYLKLDNFSFMQARNDEPRSPEEAAETLWHEFISHAGIDHD